MVSCVVREDVADGSVPITCFVILCEGASSTVTYWIFPAFSRDRDGIINFELLVKLYDL
jgi:hypothetical protein